MINPIASCFYRGAANIHMESEWWGCPVYKLDTGLWQYQEDDVCGFVCATYVGMNR